MDPIGPIAALIAGLSASVHCFAMCGGIASALGLHARSAGATSSGALYAASLYQGGRIAGYVIAGALCGFIGSHIAALLAFSKFTQVLRIASGVLIGLLGVRLLSRWNALRFIEHLGARFWMKLRPLVQLAGSRTGSAKPLAMGLLWSLLPCGLIYSMLMLAALSADAKRGALIMLSFGLGTLPSMLSTSLLAGRLQSQMSRRSVRIASGTLMLIFGVWTVLATVNVGASHHAHY
jgi:sulfite exporter TauE/SafE